MNRWFISVPSYIVINAIFWYLIPGIILVKTQNWSYFSSLYYCFVTVSTIGYGDMIPYSDGRKPPLLFKIWFISWILSGLMFHTVLLRLVVKVVHNIVVYGTGPDKMLRSGLDAKNHDFTRSGLIRNSGQVWFIT